MLYDNTQTFWRVCDEIEVRELDIELVKMLIKNHIENHSEFLKKAECADLYYRNKPDILREPLKKERQKTENEGETPLRNADNRIPFNFHGLLVNQKAAYMFTTPPLLDVGSKAANKKIQAFLGDKFPKACKDLCISASNATVGWVHVWKDKKSGFLKYAVVPSVQIMPIWDKGLEKQLLGVLRFYRDITEEGTEIDVYEYWNDTVVEVRCTGGRYSR